MDIWKTNCKLGFENLLCCFSGTFNGGQWIPKNSVVIPICALRMLKWPYVFYLHYLLIQNDQIVYFGLFRGFKNSNTRLKKILFQEVDAAWNKESTSSQTESNYQPKTTQHLTTNLRLISYSFYNQLLHIISYQCLATPSQTSFNFSS